MRWPLTALLVGWCIEYHKSLLGNAAIRSCDTMDDPRKKDAGIPNPRVAGRWLDSNMPHRGSFVSAVTVAGS